MSDLITHWAVYDDMARLARVDRMVDRALVGAIDTHTDAARLGAITRWGGRWVPAILADARGRAAAVVTDAALARRVAFAVGGIGHYGADVVMKPLMSRLAGADWEGAHHEMQGRHAQASGSTSGRSGKVSIREISAYYDVKVFREVYAAGNSSDSDPFTTFLLRDNPTSPGQALEAFVRALFQRALLSSHTLKPDADDLLGYIDHVLGLVQPLYIDVRLYTQVWERPEPALIARYGVDTEFYLSSDPAVSVARCLHRGGQVPQAEIDRAVAPGANAGGYGRAVELAMHALRDATRYWRHEIDAPPDVSQG